MRSILVSVVVSTLLYVFPGATCLATSQSPSDGHTAVSGQEKVVIPLTGKSIRPKLSLEAALKIAQAHVEKEKTNSPSYWLYQAHFILYGDKRMDDKDKLPCWHFTWLNDNDSRALEIVVSMDGNPMVLPSM